MNYAYRYARVSTFGQFNDGLSLPFQEAQLGSFYTSRLQSEFEDGGLFVDKASASKKMLLERPAGKAMIDRMKSGDALIFYRLDRCFRSMKDLVRMYDMWMEMGIRVFFMSEGLEIEKGNIVSKLLLEILTAVASFESALIGQRTKEGYAAARAQGQPISAHQPPLLEWRYNGTNFKLHIDEREMKQVEELWPLRFKRWPYDRLYFYCLKNKIKRLAKQPASRKNRTRRVDKEISIVYIQDMLEIYRRILYLKAQGVNVESRKFLDATARGETILTFWGADPDGDAMHGADRIYCKPGGNKWGRSSTTA